MQLAAKQGAAGCQTIIAADETLVQWQQQMKDVGKKPAKLIFGYYELST